MTAGSRAILGGALAGRLPSLTVTPAKAGVSPRKRRQPPPGSGFRRNDAGQRKVRGTKFISNSCAAVETNRPVPRKAVLIVNAHSRQGDDLFHDARRKLTAAGIELTSAIALKNPADLPRHVKEAVRSSAPMVIVGGGDGSLSCAVDDVVDKDIVFALLPLGTANSFARTLGIPLDLDGAVNVIATGRRKRVDLGVIDGDYFANCAAIGLSPMIGEGIPHKLKRYLGRIGYLIWAIWCLWRFKPFELTIERGEDHLSIPALEVRIANGRYHGGVEIVEDNKADTGELVVQVVTGRVKRRLVWNWLATMLRLPGREETTEDYRGRKMRIVTEPPLSISIDGEVVANTPAQVEIARCAIEVVVPGEVRT